ncbi:replication-relaxation family protein [Micromonospora tulbaghiae]|uniref:replication-relaxation family protein n=1 Tax=Micromonospora tulbaghiae TaxID=479978 RepID=UPI0034025544
MPDHVLRVQSVLTTRDHLLLEWLTDHGVFTTPQLAHALFPSLDFAQHRLARLTALRVIDRFRPFRPDGGSFPFHYVIDQLGAEVVAAQRDQPPPRPGHAKTNRRRWTAARTLNHRLGVNGFFTDLAGHARTHPAHTLTRWWPESRCAQTGAFARPGDPVALHALTAPIRPDGHGIWTTHGAQLPFFLEYDTGTEPLTELMRKLIGYTQLAAAGGPRWPVLFWLHSATRAHHLHQHLTTTPLTVPVATASRDHATHTRHSPAGPIWQLHGHPGPLPLADLATTTSTPPTTHKPPS